MPANVDAESGDVSAVAGAPAIDKATRRLDYLPPAFCVPDVILDVRIQPGTTTVYGLMQIHANPAVADDAKAKAQGLLFDCE